MSLDLFALTWGKDRYNIHMILKLYLEGVDFLQNDTLHRFLIITIVIDNTIVCCVSLLACLFLYHKTFYKRIELETKFMVARKRK